MDKPRILEFIFAVILAFVATGLQLMGIINVSLGIALLVFCPFLVIWAIFIYLEWNIKDYWKAFLLFVGFFYIAPSILWWNVSYSFPNAIAVVGSCRKARLTDDQINIKLQEYYKQYSNWIIKTKDNVTTSSFERYENELYRKNKEVGIWVRKNLGDGAVSRLFKLEPFSGTYAQAINRDHAKLIFLQFSIRDNLEELINNYKWRDNTCPEENTSVSKKPVK